MRKSVYEVWEKCRPDKGEYIVMKLRGTFERITDAFIFSAAYEKMYSTKTVIIEVDKN